MIKCKKVKDDKGKETFKEDNVYGRFSNFKHQFISENFEIVNREENEILYKLYLISDSWYKLCGDFTFSNYDKAPGSDERKIFNILEQCYSDLELSYNPKTLDNRSDFELPYITNGNDNAFTTTKYLMNRLYDSSDRLEDALKFIIYDPYNEENLYLNCLDFEDPETYLQAYNTQIIASLYNTRFEQELFAQNLNFATVLKKPSSKVFESMFVHNLWHLDDESKTFLNKKIDTNTLMDIQNRFDGVIDEMGDMVKPKYSPLDIKWFRLADKYHHNSATYNNDYSIYEDLIENLLDKDSFIVNCPGNFSHRPGAFMSVFLEKSELRKDGNTEKQNKEIEESNKQLESVWLITKVRYIIRPAAPSEFKENVVLSRNYTIQTTPEQGKISPITPNGGDIQSGDKNEGPTVITAEEAIRGGVQTANAPEEDQENKELEVAQPDKDLPAEEEQPNAFDELLDDLNNQYEQGWWESRENKDLENETLEEKKSSNKSIILKVLGPSVLTPLINAVKNGNKMLWPFVAVARLYFGNSAVDSIIAVANHMTEIPTEAWYDPDKYYVEGGRVPHWTQSRDEAIALGLDTNNNFEDFDDETIENEYNYVGPDSLPAPVRYQLAADNPELLPAVLIHDMDYVKAEQSDNPDKVREEANERMKKNMMAIVDSKKDQYTPEEYEQQVAYVNSLYDAVVGFGGKV